MIEDGRIHVIEQHYFIDTVETGVELIHQLLKNPGKVSPLLQGRFRDMKKSIYANENLSIAHKRGATMMLAVVSEAMNITLREE